MTKAKLDSIFAGIQGLALVTVPFLVLVDAIDWKAETVAAFSLVSGAVVTLAGRIFAPKADEAAVDVTVNKGV